jgi:hypothetical protein
MHSEQGQCHKDRPHPPLSASSPSLITEKFAAPYSRSEWVVGCLRGTWQPHASSINLNKYPQLACLQHQHAKRMLIAPPHELEWEKCMQKELFDWVVGPWQPTQKLGKEINFGETRWEHIDNSFVPLPFHFRWEPHASDFLTTKNPVVAVVRSFMQLESVRILQ